MTIAWLICAGSAFAGYFAEPSAAPSALSNAAPRTFASAAFPSYDSISVAPTRTYAPRLPCGACSPVLRGRAAVLAAERQALHEAERDERHRRGDPDRLVRREHADEERRGAHQQDRDEEGVLAADEIAEPPEHQRAERAHGEPAANARSANTNAAVGFTPEKNCFDMTAASEPYR